MILDVTFQEVSQGFGVDFGKIVPQPCGVLYTPQNLTKEQQAQARQNIGATSEEIIGDIDTALDSILAIQNELIGGGGDVNLITFNVYGTTYTAQEGMTWYEFLISKYNPTITCTHCGESKKLFVKRDSNEDIMYLYDNDCQQEMAVSISVEDIIIAHTYDTIIPDFHYDLQ